MSFTKKVQWNLTGDSGWDGEMVARWLETYAHDRIPHYTEKWLKSLGSRSKVQGEAAYAQTYKFDEYHPLMPTTVDYTVNKNTLTIEASGREVAFSEFGAGVYADPSHELASGAAALGVDIYPGTWSMGPEGAMHFLETDAATPPGPIPLAKWRYNVIPGRGMLAVWNDIKQTYEIFAQAAFQHDMGIDD